MPADPEDAVDGWVTATVQCRLCDYRHVSVYPVDILDEDMQECPECGHFSCEPVDDDDEFDPAY